MLPHCWYDGIIIIVWTQISLDSERQARARAAQPGVSLAEYVRRLVDRDLNEGQCGADRSTVFNLGTSQGTDIASQKARMIGEATAAAASAPSNS